MTALFGYGSEPDVLVRILYGSVSGRIRSGRDGMPTGAALRFTIIQRTRRVRRRFALPFVTVILPIFLVFGLGYVLGTLRQAESKTLVDMALYLFTPSLIFSRLITSPISLAQAGRIAVYTFAMCGIVYFVATIIARARGLNRLDRYALLLTTVTMIAANYGLPVVEFAVGRHAISYAAVFVLAANIVQSTVGVYLAAAGRRSMGQAFLSVFRLPLVYAFACAFLIRGLNLTLPEPLLRPIILLGDAAIPVAMVILGIQLTKVHIGGAWADLGTIALVRLVCAPLVGLGLAFLLGITGDMRMALILEAGMPTAVNAGLLAAEFDTKPAFVAGAILVTTLTSAITLSVFITVLGPG